MYQPRTINLGAGSFGVFWFGQLFVPGADANGGIYYFPKAGGVTLQHLVNNPSQALTVLVQGNQITVLLGTNAQGIATSTAAQVVAAVQALSAANSLVQCEATGPGASVAGQQQLAPVNASVSTAVVRAMVECYMRPFQTVPPASPGGSPTPTSGGAFAAWDYLRAADVYTEGVENPKGGVTAGVYTINDPVDGIAFWALVAPFAPTGGGGITAVINAH